MTKTSNSFSVTWSNISLAADQEFFWRQGSAGAFTKVEVPVGTNSHTVENLTAGQLYQFKVRVKCGDVWKTTPLFKTTLNSLDGGADDRAEEVSEEILEAKTSREFEILLRPNPSSDWVGISTDLRGEKILSIRKLDGSEIFRKNDASEQEAVPLAGFPAGIYQVILTNEFGEQVAEKLVKI